MYNANNLINKNKYGYNIRTSKGDINTKRFINSLDYSLDSIKLKEVYEKTMRRKDFSFKVNGKEYTQVVINVKFSYSYKEFNKAGKNIYIRAGYTYNDCEFKDCLAFNNMGALIGIIVNKHTPPPVDISVLGNNFEYSNGMFKQVGNIPVIQDKAQLREYLYKNGFICDGIKYVRYKRSCGSSRVGKCLFVNEIFAKKMSTWDKCGLTIKEGNEIDLAGYEAYISLPMSSIIDTIDILPENILVIDDYESVFKDTVVSVDEKNNGLNAEEKEIEITNSIWDGQSLMDVSLFGDYSDKGMLLLRNRFFKTCAFNTNIQKFFKDNNIHNINQLNGFTLANRIEDIKLITTPSSIKYLKFGSLEQWLKNIDITFGIVKYEKKTHNFNGRMVRTHYQLINTLQLTYEETEELLKPTLDYITQIRNDPDVLRHHIKYPYKQFSDSPLLSKNDIIFSLLGINNKFAQTKLYYSFRNDLIRSMLKEVRNGRVLVNGNYSTIFGNGSEMLKASIGKFNGLSELNDNEIRSTRFNESDCILGSRSPHITMGNIALFKNVKNNFYDKYFNLSQEIVCINSIGQNILQRLNGCDFDSDTMLLTDNKILVNSAIKNFNRFKVPTCMVSSTKRIRYYTPEQQADLDIKTSVNKIGEIVNLSQQLNSLFWDEYKTTGKYNMELYNDICKLAVASNIEIDRAKKEFTLNTVKELQKLKDKYLIEKKENEYGDIIQEKKPKPVFFKNITLGNGYTLSEKNKYVFMETPMDYVQRIVNNFKFHKCRTKSDKVIPFIEVIKEPNVSINKHLGYYTGQVERILDNINQAYNDIKRYKSNYSSKTEEERNSIINEINVLTQECVNYISDMCRSEAIMYLLLKEISEQNNPYFSRFIFNILFATPNKTFFNMIKNSKEDLFELVEVNCEADNIIKIYDFSYYKNKIS